jgi:selenocysteine-specific elongation factor
VLNGLPVAQLVGRAGVPWNDRDALLAQLGPRAVKLGNVVVSRSRLAAVEEATLGAVTQYHSRHPLEEGMPREELRERLFGDAPAAVFEEALRVLVQRGGIVARERVALAGRTVALDDREARTRDEMVTILREAGLTPPATATLAERIGVKPESLDRIANLLTRQRVIVRIGALFFDAEALARLKAEIHALKQTGAAATLDVAAFKDRYNVSRKYAIPLLEYLDRERVTARVGDARRIL